MPEFIAFQHYADVDHGLFVALTTTQIWMLPVLTAPLIASEKERDTFLAC